MGRNVKVRPWSERVPYYFRVGSDLQRAVYVAARKLMRPGLALERQRLARELSGDAPFAIPRDTGYRAFPAGHFPEAGEIVAAARDAVRRGREENRIAKARKPFLAGMLDPATLTLDSALMRLALRPDVVAAVARYLGVVPILQYVNVFYSGHVDQEPSKSQLYHCDSDDTTQMKIFVLCSDVRRENGPLTVLSAAQSARLRRTVGYEYKFRVTDEQAAPFVPGHEEAMLGPAGTTCFVDTSRCFHYGSRVEGSAEPRVIAMLQYLTPYAFILPGDPRRVARFRHLATPALPRLSRFILGAE